MDTALVQRAQAGDEAAFAALATASGSRLLAVAYRILRDLPLAEDAVQQTLVAAWRDLPSLRDPERFDAWLYRMLVHNCYREIRQSRRRAANVRVLGPADLTEADAAVSVVQRDQLDRGFRRLPADQRAVFVFRHYLGMTEPEIAEHLGIPVGTVKSRLHYARTSMRAALEADLRPVHEPSRERLA